MNHDEVRSLFAAWESAIRTGDAAAVVRLYARDAVLLPTFSNRVRRSHPEIMDYFVPFVARGASATIDDASIRVFGDLAVQSGICTFRFARGPVRAAQARFTFVYRRGTDGWRIIEHHSSAMPEPTEAGPALRRVPATSPVLAIVARPRGTA
jgi:uncharacterized protein (TIGR02246 family)